MSSELTEILARIRHVEDSTILRNNMLTHEVITLNKLLREKQRNSECNQSTINMFEELFARVQLFESTYEEHKKTIFFLHDKFEKLQWKVESILSKLEHGNIHNIPKSNQFSKTRPATQLPFPNIQSIIEDMIAKRETQFSTITTGEPFRKDEDFPTMGHPFQFLFESQRPVKTQCNVDIRECESPTGALHEETTEELETFDKQ